MKKEIEEKPKLTVSRNVSAEELLSFLVESGQLDLESAEDELRTNEMNSILEKHKYAIYVDSHGYWCTYAPDPTKRENRRKFRKRSPEELNIALYEYYTGILSKRRYRSVTIEELYPRWIEFKALHTDAMTTITRLQSDWRSHYEGTAIIKRPIVRLRKIDLDEWAHRLIKEKELTRKSWINIASIINQILNYAVDLEIIGVNPFSSVKIKNKHIFKPEKKKDSLSQVYTKEEERELEKLAWDDFYNRVKIFVLAPLAVLFQFETGVRIGELVVLRYEDLEGDYIRVQRMFRRDTREVVPHTKGTYGERRVILTSKAKMIIQKCYQYQVENDCPADGYIFSINDNPLSYFSVTDLYEKYCAKLGIEKKTSHKARKTYISALLDGDININSVREMVGHRDESTTYSNYYYDRNTDAEKVRLIEEALKL
jgi:integrase